MVADRTPCACATQITEHGFTEARRLRQRPADRKKCRLSQVEEGPPGIVPRVPNSGSGRSARRELDLPGPPDFGGSDRGRANFGQGTPESFVIRSESLGRIERTIEVPVRGSTVSNSSGCSCSRRSQHLEYN